MDARRVIAALREGRAGPDELAWFARGLASGDVSDAQAGAFAMAAFLKGLGSEGRVALTRAMRDTGRVLDWDLPGPVLDKHSTGGVGDCLSLVLAPALAALGAYVPMISGRGLGHTGGTLDKLEAIPGLSVEQDEAALRRIVGETGLAIVAATRDIAPADRRLYAVRDVTATVESLDLITASILSKKLAAGTDALILDVKIGSGAFMQTAEEARALARALGDTARGAGCPTTALITDMSQPLAPAIGNAVEVACAIDTLRGTPGPLAELAAALGGRLLALAGASGKGGTGAGQGTADEAAARIAETLSSGAAADRFAAMVAAQGGPADLLDAPDRHLPRAPVTCDILAEASGHLAAMDGRALGLAAIDLGAGRRRESDRVDPAVGFSDILRLGAKLDPGQRIARIHAATDDAAAQAEAAFRAALRIEDAPPDVPPLIHEEVS
ncbi:thymidine phosphorylase [Mesobaculum littorinae]|uniref:Thymidine phosphorylase n=1 Tax=Mesobaculum littorinae TaxID=2486419 RepID=A0A438AI53_9RHOB|nr:thymidine phosphorylase [Mesobaculum littorinae]RVV98423.1 thymidine phosphorylase [Mesobaculum littorinae]